MITNYDHYQFDFEGEIFLGEGVSQDVKLVYVGECAKAVEIVFPLTHRALDKDILFPL